MIDIRELTVCYGSVTAVDGLTLSVKSGELFGLIGPNGAGKTTTLKVLAGLLLPTSGAAAVGGMDVAEQRRDVQRNIGYMADFFGVYDYLTTVEYLAFFGAMYGVPERELADRIDEQLAVTNLLEKRGASIRELSRGMKQRLYFARALIHDPDLLILDEPASGMDPRGRAELVETLAVIHARGKTIAISSHILGELEDLCTSIGVLERGKLAGTHALRQSGSEAATCCTVVLRVHLEDERRALDRLGAMSLVSGVEKDGDKLVIRMSGDDSHSSEIVSDLVGAGVRVLLPRHGAESLQDLFMQTTRGELS